MCNLSWTPHSSLEKDNSPINHCVSPGMGCLWYYKELRIRRDVKYNLRIFHSTAPIIIFYVGQPVKAIIQ